MYIPIYKINDRLLNSIVKLETAKATLANTHMSGIARGKLEKRVKVMNLFHIAHMAGLQVTLKDIEKYVEGKGTLPNDLAFKILGNVLKVMEFTRSSDGERYVDVDLNLLIHMNKLLISGWKEQWEARIKTSVDKEEPNFERLAEMRDQNLPIENLTSEMQELIEWFRSTNTRVNPLLRASLFVMRFLELAPFPALNLLTAITLMDFLTFKYGYAREAYLPVSRLFTTYSDELLQGWGLSKERTEYAEWLETIVKNLNTELEDVKLELQKHQEAEKQSQSQPFLDLNNRQLKILRYLQTIPTVKREDYCQMMDVSTMTAFRDLSDLVDKKLLKIEGQGRGTKYMLYSR